MEFKSNYRTFAYSMNLDLYDMGTKFKIGDKVNYIFTGHNYEIIADKETPYKQDLGIINSSVIYPLDGKDFVLMKLKIEPGKREDFVHANKEHLTLIT